MTNIVNLLPYLKNWSQKEKSIFQELYEFRRDRGRRSYFVEGYNDEHGPYFSLFVIETGEVIMHISRTTDGVGYSITGPTRDAAECDTLDQLYAVYVALDPTAFPRIVASK